MKPKNAKTQTRSRAGAEAPRIGVVLSSGGARGVYAHTGFLLALERLGIPIAAAAGCSAGAVVGGVVASGADLHQWSEALGRIDSRRFWTPDPWPVLFWRILVRRGRGYTGLSGTEAAAEFCRSQLAARTFEECRYPFYALAVSLGRGRKTVFASGELAPRIVASAAMPLLYRPVEIEGDWYCDGALVDLAPMDAICCKHGLDALIIHHVAARPSKIEDLARLRSRPWSMLEIVSRLLFWRRPWYATGEPLSLHRCPGHCGAAIVVLEPSLPPLDWPLTEGGAAVQAAAGEQAETILRSHMEALSSDPRRRLPVPPDDAAAPEVRGEFCERD